MIFELGKYYRHPAGKEIHVVAVAETTIYGHCLIAEDYIGDFMPVGETEENTVNWSEITSEEWMKNFNTDKEI